MADTEIVKLYHTDYVIVLKMSKEFVKFSNGEILIYNDIHEASITARQMNAYVTSCTSVSPERQEEILNNIIEFKK